MFSYQWSSTQRTPINTIVAWFAKFMTTIRDDKRFLWNRFKAYWTFHLFSNNVNHVLPFLLCFWWCIHINWIFSCPLLIKRHPFQYSQLTVMRLFHFRKSTPSSDVVCLESLLHFWWHFFFRLLWLSGLWLVWVVWVGVWVRRVSEGVGWLGAQGGLGWLRVA